MASPSTGLTASTTPMAVATPLPPTKRKNTGYKCPKNAAKPTSATVPASRPYSAPQVCTANTGSQPLKASSNNVSTAASLLPERSTLVAPGFLLP